jgi:hypothetical protein
MPDPPPGRSVVPNPDDRVTTERTASHARRAPSANRDSLRYLRPYSEPGSAGWPALPARDRALLTWLAVGEVITAELAALLVYGHPRVARRRLARLREYGLLRGFWTANAQRPRGRHAYELTKGVRAELERLIWQDAAESPRRRTPTSPAIHQLATHDLLAALLAAARPEDGTGLFAWLPERACAALFGGYLQPDALAGIRCGRQAIAMFVERDLGTERGPVVVAKAQRYIAMLGSRDAPGPVNVGFVVESGLRARSVLRALHQAGASAADPHFWVAVQSDLRRDAFAARWHSSEGVRVATLGLPGYRSAADEAVLGPQCLLEPAALEALDERALDRFPVLSAFVHPNRMST